ncbi:MAG: hypothetical protein MZU97_03105 [Bacillus subtilis]|nr:hypothetical protein [Bacillus subtilis]
MVTGNAELAERNSDKFDVDYDVQGIPDYANGKTFIQPWVTGAEVQANVERQITNGRKFTDGLEAGPSSTIKVSNFLGYLDRNIYDRTKRYSLESNYINIRGYHDEINQLLFSNSLEGKHFILGSVLDWGCFPVAIHE